MDTQLKTSHQQTGSAHAVIIIVIVVALFAALGAVFYKNYIAKTDDTSSKSSSSDEKPSQKESTIVEVAGTDMMRFTNYDLGFQFDFPKQISGTTGCKVDGASNTPNTAYTTQDGLADMTVLESANKFTITQKKAPLLTLSRVGDNDELHFSECEIVAVSQKAIDDSLKDSDKYYLSAAFRSWQVFKLESQDEIADKASELPGYDTQNVTSTQYTLGPLKNGRQAVEYNFTYKPDTETGVDGGIKGAWYYPKEKLLVHIALGHSLSFMKPNSTDSYYIGEIVDSFKLVK